MTKTRNPWISFADLLSSVVLILLILYVLATVVPKLSQISEERDLMSEIKSGLKQYEASGQVKVHMETGTLEFTSMTFDTASAELSSETGELIHDLASRLIGYMSKHPEMEVLIEGHTDPRPIKAVINRGGHFSNNVQLSTLRAATVRAALLHVMGMQYASRIGVAGYGETRLKDKKDPFSAANRRVEIRLLWNGLNNNE